MFDEALAPKTSDNFYLQILEAGAIFGGVDPAKNQCPSEPGCRPQPGSYLFGHGGSCGLWRRLWRLAGGCVAAGYGPALEVKFEDAPATLTKKNERRTLSGSDTTLKAPAYQIQTLGSFIYGQNLHMWRSML
jgi:hypothetical protein